MRWRQICAAARAHLEFLNQIACRAIALSWKIHIAVYGYDSNGQYYNCYGTFTIILQKY